MGKYYSDQVYKEILKAEDWTAIGSDNFFRCMDEMERVMNKLSSYKQEYKAELNRMIKEFKRGYEAFIQGEDGVWTPQLYYDAYQLLEKCYAVLNESFIVHTQDGEGNDRYETICEGHTHIVNTLIFTDNVDNVSTLMEKEKSKTYLVPCFVTVVGKRQDGSLETEFFFARFDEFYESLGEEGIKKFLTSLEDLKNTDWSQSQSQPLKEVS